MRTTEMRWTAEQAAAIRAPGHTLLEANAGTGKTTTVIGKILWQLGLPVGEDESGNPITRNEQPCGLEQIAAITFTEKAAYDLKRKLREAIRASTAWEQLRWQIDRAAIGTIHSFCADLLREHALRFGIDPGFRVLDEMEAQLEQDELIKDALISELRRGDEGLATLVADRGLQRRTYTNGAVDLVRAMMRDLRWHPERYAEDSRGGLDVASLRQQVQSWDELEDEAARVMDSVYRLARQAVERWRRYQVEENALDFDGLILRVRDGLVAGGGASPASASLRRRYRLLIIDEFQDTDGAQRDIAFAIAGIGDGGGGGGGGGGGRGGGGGGSDGGGGGFGDASATPQLFLVGDPKQSIYRFRGADISVWGEAKRAICGDGEPHKLTRNFRSEPAVVEFVNRVCAGAMTETDAGLAVVGTRARVGYVPLVAHREATAQSGVEWMEVPPTSATRTKKSGAPAAMGAGERRDEEAKRVAARIRQLVGENPDGAAPYRYGDIAVLFATRTGLDHYEAALREQAVPYYLAGDAGLTERLEVLDLVNVLKVLDDPSDDLRVFAYLRSPFVGVRDEVLARIKLDPAVKGGTLLRRAREYAARGEWFAAAEHGEIANIEREALDRGVRLVEGLSRVSSRWPLDRLLEEILDLTGYRAHLELLDQPEPKLANVQRFVRLLQGYRTETLSSFLELWSRWQAQVLGIPQAPLYSKGDDVVTLSTVHSAKGLEWPVVFLVDTDRKDAHNLWGGIWSDRDLGPLLCPKKDAAGVRARRLVAREEAEGDAERARVLYVALTRARDRLIITGPLAGDRKGHARWLAAGSEGATISDAVPHVVAASPRPSPGLDLLDRVRRVDARAGLARPLPVGRERFARSATELLTRRRNRDEWRLKYRHGVVPRWYFAGSPAGPIPARLRGTIIHGVLERIEDVGDVADLLDVTIGALDAPELEERLGRETEYRAELEREIEGVVRSDEWAWYTEGEHHRELRFVRLTPRGMWHIGAFDLFRPDVPTSWIVDFKTHDIVADAVERTAAGYDLQALLYKRAAEALAGPARVRLHFTRPNVVFDVDTR